MQRKLFCWLASETLNPSASAEIVKHHGHKAVVFYYFD